MQGKSVGFLYAAIAKCAATPDCKVACYFTTYESLKRSLSIAQDVAQTEDSILRLKWSTGDILFDNGSIIMLRAPQVAVGDEVHEVFVEDGFEDWMKQHLEMRARLE